MNFQYSDPALYEVGLVVKDLRLRVSHGGRRAGVESAQVHDPTLLALHPHLDPTGLGSSRALIALLFFNLFFAPV